MTDTEGRPLSKGSKPNIMREIRIEKVVVNIGAGEGGDRLNKARTILKRITSAEPVLTKARKTIRELNVREREEIGTKVTLRGGAAETLLRGAFAAVNNTIKESSFDRAGNISFGISEYIFLPGVKYDPELGIFGLDVCLRLARPGLRVTRRKIRPGRVPRRHLVTPEEGAQFLRERFGVRVV